MPKTPAWQRKAGKNPKGGLNAKGRASYKGGTLKAPVVRGQPKKSKLSSKDGGNARTGKGLKGQTNKTSSQPKSVGSIKQSRRKTKGSSNLTKK